MKKITVKTMLVVFICTMFVSASAQKVATKDTIGLNAKTKTNIIDLLKKPIYKAGDNKVAEIANGYTLNVKIVNNKAPLFYVSNKKGITVPTKSVQKGVTCWNCFSDENGDNHCYVIPCPKVVGPFKVLAGGPQAILQ
jgi:hypothetical protein